MTSFVYSHGSDMILFFSIYRRHMTFFVSVHSSDMALFLFIPKDVILFSSTAVL